MDKLTFKDLLGDREFYIFNRPAPIVFFQNHYFPLSFVFPTLKCINWDMGYMVDKGRIIACKEASKYIKDMDWFPEEFVLSKLN